MMIKVLVVMAVVASALGFKMNMKTGTINHQHLKVQPIMHNFRFQFDLRESRNAVIQQSCLCGYRWIIRLWKYQHARPGPDES